VEVAHEALLREWGRLRGWLDESRYDVRLQRALAVVAAEWKQAGRADGFLLRDARLEQFAGWAADSTVALTEDESVFLQASIAARQARLAEEDARRQRELETARKLVEAERARAEEQTQAAGRLRQRAILLTGALVVAGVLAIAAFFFAQQSSANADEALAEADRRATAQANAESSAQEAVAQNATAEAEADIRATAEAVALTAQGAAEDEAAQRATAEALAISEREIAESQAALATSRELASKALLNLEQDPELGIILALQALSTTNTIEAQEALHSTIQGSRVRQTLHPPDDLPAVWLSYSPDGSRLFTSGLNGGTMWDMTTGAAVFTHTLYITPDLFSGYFSSEQSEWFIDLADFSPDGSLLALPVELMTGDKAQPGYISILDPETGEEMSVFLADESGIGNVTFNQDGSQLASTSLVGGKTTIWNVAETLATGIGQEVTSLCCHEGWAWSVKYDPNGSRLVTTGSDDTLKVWSVETGSELLSVAGLGARDAVFSPDGRYLVVGGERAVSILDAATGEIINNVPGPGQTFYTVLFSPDGTHLAASNFDGNVRIWNYADGELGPISLLLSGHKAAAGGISFTPDGRYLASGSSDGTARVWDVSLNGGGEFGTYSHDNRVMDVAFTPDGSWLVSTGIDNTAKIWDTAAEQERFTLRHDDWVVGAAVHPDGHTLATSSNDGTVRIWDANTGEQKLIIQAHETIDFGYLRGAKGIAFSPDGQRLATSGADKLVKVWDAETGEELFTMTGHTGTINAVAYSPDGRWLISASNDGAVKVWDPVDGHELWTLPGDRVVFEASFSLDSSRLVAGQQDGWVTIWSFPTQGTDPEAQPERLLDFQPRPQAMAKGVFSPDGNQLVIAGSIQTSIHDARTGELQVILGYPATKATFSPDGRLVATAGNDGLVRLFAADQEELLALAQSRVTRSLTTEECQQYLHLDACPVP
jgi:WD40 repeat protein